MTEPVYSSVFLKIITPNLPFPGTKKVFTEPGMGHISYKSLTMFKSSSISKYRIPIFASLPTFTVQTKHLKGVRPFLLKSCISPLVITLISFLNSTEIHVESWLESSQVPAGFSSEQQRFSSPCQLELIQIDSEVEID